MAETKSLGDFNGHGSDYRLSMGGLLYGIRAVTKSGAKLREASAEFLSEHKVSMWRDLPVWVPGSGTRPVFFSAAIEKRSMQGSPFARLP